MALEFICLFVETGNSLKEQRLWVGAIVTLIIKVFKRYFQRINEEADIP